MNAAGLVAWAGSLASNDDEWGQHSQSRKRENTTPREDTREAAERETRGEADTPRHNNLAVVRLWRLNNRLKNRLKRGFASVSTETNWNPNRKRLPQCGYLY